MRWALLLALGGCASFLSAAGLCASEPAGAAARLDGRAAVTEGDLSDWQAAQACYGEGALTSRRAALMRLVEAAIAGKAMLLAGRAGISDSDLSAEAERIDRETRAPEILACIKKALAPRERYLRVFVRPTLVESRLRAFLIRDPGVQAGPRGRIEKALSRARKGVMMENAAKEAGLAYSSSTYSLAPSTDADTAARYGGGRAAPWSPFEEDFIRRFLQELKPGTLRKEPIETDYDFRIVRLLHADGVRGRWTFESVSAAKISQEEWFKSLPKMKLEIMDEEMRAWIKSIQGNPRLAAAEIR